jgi:inhibitor of KinA sporulation pathway (predicted exonuclease)
LTHITDEQVNKGLEWKVCLYEFEKWCLSNAITHENTTVITCGDWDLQIMLPRQLQLSKTKLTPYLRTILCAWTDIKVYYKHQTKSKSRGMAGMLEYLKIELTGHHHSGIDDCRNIAKICNYLIGQGSIITNTTCHNPKN